MKKVLATVLALVMALALCSVSWADGATAITADMTELDTGSYELTGDVTLTAGALTVKSGATVTLDLGTFTLTNKAGEHTIVNNGTLTITGTGTVDNVSHARAALVNKEGATAELNGGSFTRSKENGQNKEDSGGNSYYNIQNFGMMTINDGVLVKQDGGFSSMVANGYYDGTGKTNTPTLVINGGKFIGGLNTIKNDDCGKLTIINGVFENVKQHAVFNVNEAVIKGGTYTMDGNDSVLYNRKYDDANDKGLLTVEGGTFTAKDGVPAIKVYDVNSKPTITGGTFSSDVDAYVAADKIVQKDGGAYKVVADGAITSGTYTSEPTVPSGYKVTDNGDGTWTVTKISYYYYSPSTTTPDTTTKGSPKTFDAGIALYVGMALTSVTGLAYTGKKKF